MPRRRKQNELYAPLGDPEQQGIAAEPVQEIHALVRRVNDRPEVRACFEALASLLGDDEEPLAEFLRLALLGVAVGFVERNLSPHLAQHRRIVPPLLDDIRGVYGMASTRHADYDPDEFRHRAYHYGLHKASYLDWDLYLSHEMY
jgi:hypothetical protein